MVTPADTARPLEPQLLRPGVPTRLVGAPPAAVVFGGTIGLSAFLLFTAEPMVARLAQPVFGGAPAVWATVLVFFQVMLLLGYAYAHLVATRLAARPAALLHVSIAATAAELTIAAPRSVAGLVDPGIPTIPNVLLVLLAVAGPATFVMTSTTPLVSSWYARERLARDPDGDRRDPYWLYALSNFGSLVSLLAYPFLIEPLIGLSAQRVAWTAGFGLLVGFLAVAALRFSTATAVPSTTARVVTASGAHRSPPVVAFAGSSSPRSRADAGRRHEPDHDRPPERPAAVGHPAGDLPRHVRRRVLRAGRRIARDHRDHPGGPDPAVDPAGFGGGWPIVPLLLIDTSGWRSWRPRSTATRRRPAAARGPDRFYLTMSAGGAIGGVFVGIVAPLVFPAIWDTRSSSPPRWSCSRGRGRRQRPRSGAGRSRASSTAGAALVPYLLVAVGLIALMRVDGRSRSRPARWLMVGASSCSSAARRACSPRPRSSSWVVTVVLAPPAVFRDRSCSGWWRSFASRTESRCSCTARPCTAPVARPRSSTRAGLVLRPKRAHGRPVRRVDTGGRRGPRRRARPGSLAAYNRPRRRLPVLRDRSADRRVAEDPSLFTFLQDAQGSTSIRIGDGRLLVADDPDASADLVILDAFTSDAVPVHLITAESLADVARTLRPGGVVAVHVSNRYYDLEPPVSAGLEAAGLNVVRRVYTPTKAEGDDGASISHWLGRRPAGRVGRAPRGADGSRLVIAPCRRPADRRLRGPAALPARPLGRRPRASPRLAPPGAARRRSARPRPPAGSRPPSGSRPNRPSIRQLNTGRTLCRASGLRCLWRMRGLETDRRSGHLFARRVLGQVSWSGPSQAFAPRICGSVRVLGHAQ